VIPNPKCAPGQILRPRELPHLSERGREVRYRAGNIPVLKAKASLANRQRSLQ
jgi:hypothetical protein